MEPSAKPVELSFPLPRAPHSVLHAHVTFLKGCVMAHLTTTTIGESTGSLAPLGSFVYAMADTRSSRSAISTALISTGSSIDYAMRLAKILTIKFKQPVYVGCSMNFAGISADEEMEGLAKIVNEIYRIWQAKNQQAIGKQ